MTAARSGDELVERASRAQRARPIPTQLPATPHPEERRRRRRISKDAPAHERPSWIVLRHAMLRIAAQDEDWRGGELNSNRLRLASH
jgi:hypothetical protein